jgi:uncharacterized protein YegP (UPF0339 family)
MSEVLLLLGGGLAGVAGLLGLARTLGPLGGGVVAMAAEPPGRRHRVLMAGENSWTPRTPRTPRVRRGADERHLMVGLRLRSDRLRVSSVAVAHGRPPQLIASRHPWLAAVVRRGEIVHLSRVPDPFGGQGQPTPQSRVAGADPEGRAVVAIPFRTATDLTGSLVHVLRLDDRGRQADPSRLDEEVRRRLDAHEGVRTLGFDAVQASPHWSTVGPLLGMAVDPARFEIYRDPGGQWRWRMRRAGGAVVAVASTGHVSRPEAEAELAWLRGQVADSPTTVVD